MSVNARKGITANRRNFRLVTVASVSAAMLFGLVATGAGAAQATVSTPASLTASAISELTNPPGPCDPGEVGQEKAGFDGKMYVCSSLGSAGNAPDPTSREKPSSQRLTTPILDNESEKYIRGKHVEGGSAVDPSKSVFNRDVNLDELVERSLTVKPTGPNKSGFFERVVDAGAIIGRSSKITGSHLTSKYMLVQDRFGGIVTMYPLLPN